MATQTINYNLIKPEGTDQYQQFITWFANNMDIIDQYLGQGSGGVSDVQVDGTSVVTAGVANILLQSVSNLANYYLKSETYTQAEVDALISAVSTISIEVVQALPTTNIKTNVIYLVPKSPSQTNNYYDEYINTTGTSAGWELIGDTEIDLSNYVTFTDLNTELADYVTSSGLTTILASYYTKTQTDNLLSAKQDNLTFVNVTDQTGNTVTVLPFKITGSVANGFDVTY